VDQVELEGMPEPAVLRLLVSDGRCLVTCGRVLVYRYDSDDLGMRNLAIVALTDAGRRVDEVAAVFGLTATYVSMLRGRARTDGSAGLVRRRGRPPKLSDRQVEQAREWSTAGWTQQGIADRLGVARSVISELLARWGPAPVQQVLPTAEEPAGQPTEEPAGQPTEEPAGQPTEEPAGQPTEEPAEQPAGGSGEQAMPEPLLPEPLLPEPLLPGPAGAAAFAGSARITTGTYPCRYAGAMLLYPYLHRVGAEAIFATVTGGPARRYDDLAVLTTSAVGFALGIDTVEGSKHLRRAEAGAAVGLGSVPELKTLRTRLGALADGADPLRLQRGFAAGMLTADPAADPVYFVDDHFVAYSGARPVGKGWNTKRRHAQPGRDDTLVVDARGRAVVFGSGEPSGLVSTLPAVLTQLRAVLGPGTAILLGFDRGGGLPVRVQRLPRRGRGLGHLPACPAGRHDRHTAQVLDDPRRPADQRDPGR
jgi:transposase